MLGDINAKLGGENIFKTTIGKGVYRVLMGKPEGKNHLEDPGVDGMRILRWIFRKWERGMDWIDLTQYRNRWPAVVNAVLNLGGSLKCGEFLD